MLMLDVNVLVNAMRSDAPRHDVVRAWLDAIRNRPEPFGVSELVLAGLLRVVTHRRVFSPPTSTASALAWVSALRATPNLVLVAPGPRHWEIFEELIASTAATGNLVADAWHAALAIEHGCEWVSDDSDFARFDGLRWSRPA
ncbi:MAG TPA: type II toxin-antitoxin system VapC family toxin [Gemmatimonas sp.]|nr:type II toxin-antitoxin system VapC family toxin [Gemmatimonas sp.]